MRRPKQELLPHGAKVPALACASPAWEPVSRARVASMAIPGLEIRSRANTADEQSRASTEKNQIGRPRGSRGGRRHRTRGGTRRGTRDAEHAGDLRSGASDGRGGNGPAGRLAVVVGHRRRIVDQLLAARAGDPAKPPAERALARPREQPRLFGG